MGLIVLGMHRSGTSGVTRLLNLAGAYFGPPGIATEANEENPKGFWERRDVRAVCDGLLQGSGFDWHRLAGFSTSSIPGHIVATQSDAFRSILEDLDDHRPWVVKEPRLCLLLPVLEPLVENPVCVHVSRDPLEVARSVRHRNQLPLTGALALWELYTLRALESSAHLPRVHVRHSEVIADPVGTLTRLIADLEALGVAGLTMPSDDEIHDFISPGLHRQHSDPDERRLHLNPDQVALADRLDRDPFPRDLPELSVGAADALSDLVVVADRMLDLDTAQAEVRHLTRETQRLTRSVDRASTSIETLERDLQRERNRRDSLASAATEALDRAERDIRAMRAGRIADAAAYAVAIRRTITPGLHRTDPTPFSRALAGVEKGRRTIRGRVADLRPEGDDNGDPGPSAGARVTITRSRPPAAPSDRPKLAVLSWDVGHNPLGRANVLAEVMARDFEVELWGAQFDRYGTRIWAPMRDISTPVNSFPGRPFPDHLAVMEQVAAEIEADMVWISKPRLPSLMLGSLAKSIRNRPLILDVDDHELAFFTENEGVDLHSISSLYDDSSLELPFERAWTRVCEPLIAQADRVTVSNVALQKRFGGTIVPHARDETVFDPDRIDREQVRHRLGISPAQRVILFGGTPRLHKGILEILRALEKLNDPRYRLIIFGTREFDELRPHLGDLVRWLLPLPYQPFSSLPEVVAAADLTCILQDPDHPVSAYQLPAKLTDALAMGLPVLVRPTPPLQPFIDAGAVGVVHDPSELADAISAIFEDPVSTQQRVETGRKLFMDTMSYRAVSRDLRPMFDQLQADPPPLGAGLRQLIDTVRARYGEAPPTTPEPTRPRVPQQDRRPIPPGSTFDVVVFWKQNDTGIYGRRQEMMVDQLVNHPRVGTVVHFDNPITPEQLLRHWRDGAAVAHQGRLVARATINRLTGRANRPGLRSHTFVYGGSKTSRLGLPPRQSYVSKVSETLRREGIGQRPWVLWAYPTNNDLPELIDSLDPDVVLCDVVDDNRTWYVPGTPAHDRVDQNYRDVLTRSDVVIANCEPVAESMRTIVSTVEVIPNGVDLESPVGSLPDSARSMGHPLIGYVGNLSSRIDVDLLDEIASRRPEWTLVLAGSAHLDTDIFRLDRHANVRFVGVLPHQQARRLMAEFDVALIPHLDNEMTRAMNPLKAFVYSGVGVPVVSTPIANLGELEDLITVASGADEFISAIEHHLKLGHRPVDPQRLAPHGWKRRIDAVVDLIDQLATDLH